MSASSTGFAGTVPENYGRFLEPLLFEPYAIDLVSRVPKNKMDHALELACGTGAVTGLLRQALPEQATLETTDLNPGMLTVAQKNVPAGNIRWSVVDMQQIPYPDNHFDLVVCQFGVMFVPDKPKALKEIRRVLKKGGLFLFNSWDKLENNPALFLGDKVVNTYFKQDPVTFYKVPYSLHDKELIKTLLTEAGFSNVAISLVSKQGIIESVDQATAGIVEGTPAYGYICERNAALIPAIKESLKAELLARFGDHPMKTPLQAWVIEAT